MAKWTLPDGRKPITTLESADLVLRMHKKLEAGFSRGDRIAELEELYEAAKQDAKEAEAYATELEAKLAKAVDVGNKMAKSIEGNYYIPSVAKEWRTTLAELKGQDDE